MCTWTLMWDTREDVDEDVHMDIDVGRRRGCGRAT